ncbi:MAG: PIN domain-containing protein [Deltaproteobacteria bacterium]|nr:PIN domain-containing protein [Deltaproteobacteria bacterium]
MTDKVLIDTSVWIDYFRYGSTELSQILEKLGRERRAATCGIIIAELLHGAKTSGEEQTFLRMAHSLPFIEADREDWLETGALLLQLRKKGITVPLADALIARLAIKSGCELLAVDKHFDHFKAVRRFKRKGRARR